MNTKLFRRSLQWTAIILCFIFVCLYAWQYYVVDRQLPIVAKAADFTLNNSQGNQVNMNQLNGKVRLVYFFFASCPDVCSPTTKKLAGVQEQLKKAGYPLEQIQFISVTVDPQNDNEDALNEFARRNGAQLNNWSFLYGNEQTTDKVAKKYGVGVLRGEKNQVQHNNQVVLVDQDGNIRAIYEDYADQKIDYNKMFQDVKSLF